MAAGRMEKELTRKEGNQIRKSRGERSRRMNGTGRPAGMEVEHGGYMSRTSQRPGLGSFQEVYEGESS